MGKKNWLKLCIGLCVAATVVGCSSSKRKVNEPAPLPAYTSELSLQPLWRADLGKVDFPLVPKVMGSYVILAASNGTVMSIEYSTGRVVWRSSAGDALSAGVGSNGSVTAVVTRNNDLVAFDSEGSLLWRQRVAAQVLTPPVVAGGRVFVNATDRSIQAYDAQNGAGLWRQQQNIMDALTLHQNGVLDTYGNTLIVGLSANLYAVDPDTGVPHWGLPIGSPRGSNEIDRLADLVGGIGRYDSILCARSYQNAISCVEAEAGVLWSRKSDGSTGVDVDSENVYAAEKDGRILALDQKTGNVIWTNDSFKWRTLTAPLVIGGGILIIGDSDGYVHFLSRSDGRVIGRLSTDRSGIAATPIALSDVLMLVTKNGTVYAFRLE
ncbi:MAG: outer membrane protein assembly factor BamB [Saezia sp.]